MMSPQPSATRHQPASQDPRLVALVTEVLVVFMALILAGVMLAGAFWSIAANRPVAAVWCLAGVVGLTGCIVWLAQLFARDRQQHDPVQAPADDRRTSRSSIG